MRRALAYNMLERLPILLTPFQDGVTKFMSQMFAPVPELAKT